MKRLGAGGERGGESGVREHGGSEFLTEVKGFLRFFRHAKILLSRQREAFRAVTGCPGGRCHAAVPSDLRFAIRFKVINAGVGGESDREKMRRFESDVLAKAPDILLVQFGGNNAGFISPDGVHLTVAGNRLLADLVLAQVRGFLA